MKFNLSLLLSSVITVGLLVPANAVKAQTSAPTAASTERGLDFKLNPQQRKAIEAIGVFALDQMENMIANGMNPKKVDRVAIERQSETLRQNFSSLRLDGQQKAALRTILQSAREQMKRQLENR